MTGIFMSKLLKHWDISVQTNQRWSNHIWILSVTVQLLVQTRIFVKQQNGHLRKLAEDNAWSRASRPY